MDFGDYVLIEQKRYGIQSEMYVHKVIGAKQSNCWVDVPVQSPATEVLHEEMADVVACICCGVDERAVMNYRMADVIKQEKPSKNWKPSNAALTGAATEG